MASCPTGERVLSLLQEAKRYLKNAAQRAPKPSVPGPDSCPCSYPRLRSEAERLDDLLREYLADEDDQDQITTAKLPPPRRPLPRAPSR